MLAIAPLSTVPLSALFGSTLGLAGSASATTSQSGVLTALGALVASSASSASQVASLTAKGELSASSAASTSALSTLKAIGSLQASSPSSASASLTIEAFAACQGQTSASASASAALDASGSLAGQLDGLTSATATISTAANQIYGLSNVLTTAYAMIVALGYASGASSALISCQASIQGTAQLMASNIRGNNVSSASASPGQALLWNGSQWGAGNVASTANLPTLVFQPGGTATYNTFTTWASLMTAFNATTGPVLVSVDSSFGAASVPVGVWDMQGRAILTATPQLIPGAFGTSVVLTMPEGAVLKDAAAFEGCLCLDLRATITSCLQLTNNRQMFVRDSAQIQNYASGAQAPALRVAANETVFIYFQGLALYDNNASAVANPFIDLGANSTAYVVFGAMSSCNGTFLYQGAASSTMVFVYDSTYTYPLPANPGYAGNYIPVPFSYASRVFYDDTAATPLLGSSDVQGAIDALKGQVNSGVVPKFGNVLVVDAINGNDATGSVDGLPFATPEGAIAYINAHVLTGVTVWILPGTYNLSAGITIPATCSIRGMSLQTVVLQKLGVTVPTTLVTMGENSRLEDVQLKLTSSNPAASTLIGILFPGQTAQTAKLRTATLTVDNSAVATGSTTTVYGVHLSGTNVATAAVFSFNCMKGSTVNVLSNGAGNKRCVYISASSQSSTRDMNFYMAAPTNPASTGSYVAIECNNATAQIQLRSTAVRGAPDAGSYTGSDILQTLPVTQVANAGIQIGPGTDLNTKTAGGKAFSTFVTPSTLDYALKGNVAAATSYYWFGTLQTSADATQVFTRFQQLAVVNGLSVTLRTPPGGGVGVHNVTVTVLKSSTGVAGSGVATPLSVTLTDGDVAKIDLDHSVTFQKGEFICIESTTSGGAGAAADMNVQVDVF